MKRLTNSFTVPKYFFTYLAISLFCTAFSLFSQVWVQNLIAIGGILSFGILHGANDLQIIAKRTSHYSKPHAFKFFVLYIVVVLIGIILFFYFPKIALVAFVLVSCYHFGEQHWSGRVPNHFNPPVFYFLYGALIFMLLFTLRYESSSAIIFQLTAIQLPFPFFWISLIISMVGFLGYLIWSKRKLVVYTFEFLLLGVFALLFSQATLLLGFGLYFVLWHSIPSLNSQVEYIYEKKTQYPLLQYIKAAFFYWILALASLFLFYYYINVPQERYLSLFFCFLAAITFPHAVVMGLMFDSKVSNGE